MHKNQNCLFLQVHECIYFGCLREEQRSLTVPTIASSQMRPPESARITVGLLFIVAHSDRTVVGKVDVPRR